MRDMFASIEQVEMKLRDEMHAHLLAERQAFKDSQKKMLRSLIDPMKRTISEEVLEYHDLI